MKIVLVEVLILVEVNLRCFLEVVYKVGYIRFRVGNRCKLRFGWRRVYI